MTEGFTHAGGDVQPEPTEQLLVTNWLSCSAWLEHGGRVNIESLSKTKAQALAKGKRLVGAIQPVTLKNIGLDPSLVSGEIKKHLVLQAGYDSPLVVNDGALLGDFMPMSAGSEFLLAELYIAESKMTQPKSTALKRAIPGRKELQIMFGVSFFLVTVEEIFPELPQLEIIGDQS